MTPAGRRKTPAASTYARIWNVVRRIPRGRVATYGQVASLAGFPGQPRLAGYAMHALPAGTAVPWHRVVNARGRISLPLADGQYDCQRAMLEAEGIVFNGERIDLEQQGWPGRARKRVGGGANRARRAGQGRAVGWDPGVRLSRGTRRTPRARPSRPRR